MRHSVLSTVNIIEMKIRRPEIDNQLQLKHCENVKLVSNLGIQSYF